MHHCKYCGEEFDSENKYTDHLKREHNNELSRIDRRRITDESTNLSLPMGSIVFGFVIALVMVVVWIVWFSPLAESATSSTQQSSNVHYHGTIHMNLPDSEVDFSERRYQLQDDAFHFEGGDGTQWHVHAEGVTLKYAMKTLGINVTDSTVVYQDIHYRDSDPKTSVTVTVNDQPATPSEYVLQQGDHIRISVEQS